MSKLETAFSEGIIAFIATNIDDIIILLIFFSQVDGNFRRRHILLGQYLGFAAIIIASLPGFFGGLVIQREWIGLLGLLPIGIGIHHLVYKEEDTITVQTVSSDFNQPTSTNPVLSFILSVLHRQTYKVAAVTIANGGDNISVYVPLFGGHNLASLGVIISVFFIMVGIWCAIAYFLSRQPTIANILSRYGNAVVPFVLIGLGLFIMYDRGTFTLLPWVRS
ncbi:cadmium resistance transporter [Nostoc sp. NMS8]|uniref:cadmium resistance transporter n=1 Tax=Nostoc sp. NMS8 TaxID=2815392 RepID=UPI0025EC6791|nr:cadmium resistance transporter [Nostoc sp. NMS8]MBN3961600.1 cadmium resistance transporter [Nostoc sp. NMS8]